MAFLVVLTFHCYTRHVHIGPDHVHGHGALGHTRHRHRYFAHSNTSHSQASQPLPLMATPTMAMPVIAILRHGTFSHNRRRNKIREVYSYSVHSSHVTTHNTFPEPFTAKTTLAIADMTMLFSLHLLSSIPTQIYDHYSWL